MVVRVMDVLDEMLDAGEGEAGRKSIPRGRQPNLRCRGRVLVDELRAKIQKEIDEPNRQSRKSSSKKSLSQVQIKTEVDDRRQLRKSGMKAASSVAEGGIVYWNRFARRVVPKPPSLKNPQGSLRQVFIKAASQKKMQRHRSAGNSIQKSIAAEKIATP